MFLPLLVLFTGVPALELYLLFKVGAQLGALNTIIIIIVTGVLGASLAKSQGLELLMRIQNELNKGEIPAGQLLQGFLVMGGGLLLLTPGFVTDILGFCMVLPGTRSIIAIFLTKFFAGQIKKGNVHVFTNMGQGPFGDFGHRKSSSDVFDAEYSKKEDEPNSIKHED